MKNKELRMTHLSLEQPHASLLDTQDGDDGEFRRLLMLVRGEEMAD